MCNEILYTFLPHEGEPLPFRCVSWLHMGSDDSGFGVLALTAVPLRSPEKLEAPWSREQARSKYSLLCSSNRRAHDPREILKLPLYCAEVIGRNTGLSCC